MTAQRLSRPQTVLTDQAGLSAPRPLEGVPLRTACQVQAVLADARMPEQARQLEEIGFLPGEQVMLLARGVPGGDPLVVRIGQSTFALRRAEAACILVLPSDPSAAA